MVVAFFLVQIKITSDYSGLQSNNKIKIASFSYIVVNRINADSKDPQLSRKNYNIHYLLFIICGGLLFPAMLMIAYSTPLATSENKAIHKEDIRKAVEDENKKR